MRSLYILLLCLTTMKASAWNWRDVWATRDQQAAQYLKQQAYKKAEETFEDPDWRATAAYRAQDFERASQIFGERHTADGYYNQGNAEAHRGQYQAALESYQKSLKLRPADPDTQHNKKIIEALLEKEKNNQENKQQDDQKNQEKSSENKDPQPQNEQEKQSENKPSDEHQKAKDNQNQDHPSSKENAEPKQQDEGTQAHTDPKDETKENKSENTNQTQTSPEHDKSQPSASPAENYQSTEQWLNMLPDDPAGLLRQKFLRDHRRRANGEDNL